MKFIYLIFILFPFVSIAQNHHLDSLSHIDYSALHGSKLNDLWGYTDEMGNEYALVGAEKGVSVVDITDPENPTEVYWHVGSTSVWRDIKTFGDFAYITTEAEDGLLIIDLTPLPNDPIVSTINYYGDSKIWQTAHNIYIDENGYGYIFGSNYGNGGAIILDLFTDPMQPVEVGEFDNWYIHDGYVINNTLYAAHINDGFFTIVDVSDKSNPVVLGSHVTPSSFTHNIWTTTNQDYAFTTDELKNSYVAAYNISDPNNIFEVDRIQSSPGDDVVPHNTHVMGDFLYTSYYADGVVIHDVSDPGNMVEVARFDTYPGTADFTIGNWGVYPFFNSGTIIATDIENGLFILGSNFNYAAKIEGTITNLITTNPIQGVDVSILGSALGDMSKVNGEYKTGIESSGNYTLRFEKYGYETKEITVDLTENTTIIEDVELMPLPQYNVIIKVLNQNSDPILGADVRIEHLGIVFDAQTNGLGEVTQSLSYSDDFYIAVGKWGYFSECSMVSFSPSTNTFTFNLDKGYSDDFTFDFGWSATSSADQGDWERAIPYLNLENGTTSENDSPFDCGEFCFITGNSDDNSVMGGEVTLISPVFDISGLSDPFLNFDRWFYNQYGSLPLNDTLKVAISNGTNLVEIDNQGYDASVNGIWSRVSKRITDYISPTSTMQLFIQTSNYYSSNNITNAAFDNFAITNGSPLAISKESITPTSIKIYPNPFVNKITIVGNENDSAIQMFNLQGQEIMLEKINNTDNKTSVTTGHLSKGTYFLQVNGKMYKIIK